MQLQVLEHSLLSGILILLLKLSNLSAIDSTPWLVHTTSKTIQRLDMNTWTESTIANGTIGAVSVDYHYTQGFLYWTDQIEDRMTRLNLSKPNNKEDIVTYTLNRADGIAVDWIYNHVYWIDAIHKHLRVSELDGTLRKTLIDTDLGYPQAIAVNPSNGWLFFTDVVDEVIERCGLDGSNRHTIVSNKTTNIRKPRGLSIDFSSNRLYWIDNYYKQIKSSTLDGSDIKLLTTSADYMPFAWGLIVFKDWIYWTSYSNNTIYRVDKQTGSNFQIVKDGLRYPMGIKIYSQENQPTGVNLCASNNGDCEQLCLPTPQSTKRCECADGFQLNTDGKTCNNTGPGNWLTFANLNTIERIDVDTSVTEVIAGDLTKAVDLDIHYKKGFVYWTDVGEKRIMRSSVSNNSLSGVSEVIVTETVDLPYGIAVDWIYNKLFWTDTGHDHIQLANLDGSFTRTILKGGNLDKPRAIVVDPNTGSSVSNNSLSGVSEVIVTETVDLPYGIAVDWIYNKLFWTDTGHDHIQLANLDGSFTRTILKGGNLDKPRAIVVDPNTGWLFFSDWGSQPRIERCGMDGGDRRTIIQSDIVWPNGMSIDHVGRRLYWIDGYLSQIKSTKFDGADTYTIIKDSKNLPHPFDLVVFNSYIYWSNWKYRSICRVHKYTGKDFLKFANYVQSPRGIQMFGPEAQIDGDNLCGGNNGGCSHICYPLPTVLTSRCTMFQCMCPDYFVMEADNKTCTAIEPPFNLKLTVSGTSVSVSWTLPVTSDVIQETKIELYDAYNNIFYTSAVYFTESSKTISTSQLMKCHLYTIKLRITYATKGWSPYIKEHFWITDNLVFTEKESTVNISWTTRVDRSTFDVLFNKQSGQNIAIFSGGVAQNGASKYRSLIKTGLQIQFTLTQAGQHDVGLYKSRATSTLTSIDGCSLLVMTDRPLKPDITSSGAYPFVGSKAVFECSSQAKRWPSYIPANLQYSWSVDSTVTTDVLNIDPVEKSDKGKKIACTAIDDNGKTSTSSDDIILDPYYGPDNIELSISGSSVNVTKGNRFGPVTCSTSCYPKCNYIWYRLVNGIYTNITAGKDIEIDSVRVEDSGVYRCIATHQNDTSRINTVNILLHVKEPDTTTTTTTTASTTTSSTATPTSTPSSTPSSIMRIPRVTRHAETKDLPFLTKNEESVANITTYALAGVFGLFLILIGTGFIIYCLKRQRLPDHVSKPGDTVRMSTISDVYQFIDDQLLVNIEENSSDFSKSIDNDQNQTLGTSQTEAKDINCTLESQTNVMAGITQELYEVPTDQGSDCAKCRVVQDDDTYLTAMETTKDSES